jgi:hypothetical protein
MEWIIAGLIGLGIGVFYYNPIVNFFKETIIPVIKLTANFILPYLNSVLDYISQKIVLNNHTLTSFIQYIKSILLKVNTNIQLIGSNVSFETEILTHTNKGILKQTILSSKEISQLPQELQNRIYNKQNINIDHLTELLNHA